MRLGFWPRLFIAVTALSVATFGPYKLVEWRERSERVAEFMFGSCQRIADSSVARRGYSSKTAAWQTKEYDRCSKIFEADFDRARSTPEDFRNALASGVALGLAISLALRVLTALSLWVWRGRKQAT